MNEIMSEMQSGMNMPNSGSNPVMNMQFGGSNPMMGNPGMGNGMGNPMMGMGNGNPMGNPMMGMGNPGMGNPGMGNPMGNGNPMMGGMGNNSPAGLSPQITGPMGNPIMGEFQGPYDHMPVSMDGQVNGNPAIAGRNDVDEEEYEDDDPEGAEGDEGGLGGLGGQRGLRGQSTDGEKDEDDSDDNSGILDNLLESGKEPLIGAIILIMLLTPQFNAVFNQFAPRIVTENLIYSLAAKGLIFFIIFYLIQRFL
jgi:hypothetical protein